MRLRVKMQRVFYIKLVIIVFMLSFLMFIITTPVHELVHGVIAYIDPGQTLTEVHFLDEPSFKQGFLGYASVQGNGMVLFVLEETLAFFVQIMVVIATATFLSLKIFSGGRPGASVTRQH